MRDLIGLVLQPLERFDVRRAAVRGSFKQLAQEFGCFLIAIGNFGEEVEKLLFARQETHGIPSERWPQKIAALRNDH